MLAAGVLAVIGLALRGRRIRNRRDH
ncbi:hypothetical protein GA0111570_10349 [Raineyella antarctica]|uniref:Uncharacterized protein n=1 Tax=Raineyella antarctica TaxID=1577474 RepID=A0A1G6GFD5_9ACTN|nr:hypothetical protein GA0111570_10349 [Raineyella antarctica]